MKYAKNKYNYTCISLQTKGKKKNEFLSIDNDIIMGTDVIMYDIVRMMSQITIKLLTL